MASNYNSIMAKFEKGALTPGGYRNLLIDYLLAKVQWEDWHGVSDAANDLREHDAKHGRDAA
jgi:hypothetical protein